MRVPVPGAEPGRWDMPHEPVARWLIEHRNEYDVVHLHLGLAELCDAAALRAALDEAAAPLVLTVHDLPTAGHPDPARLAAQLAATVPAADELITLTVGAARQLLAEYGRTAHVLPHPHVVPEALLSAPRVAHGGFVLGLYVGSLAAGVPTALLDEAVRYATDHPGVRVQVHANPDVMEPAVLGQEAMEPAALGQDASGAGVAGVAVARSGPSAESFADALRRRASRGEVDLRIHRPSTVAEEIAALSDLDALLVWDHRAHSTWVEACFDLGVEILVPDRGHQAEQRPCRRIGPEPGALGSALQAAIEPRQAERATATARLDERRLVALAHRVLYEAVLGQGRHTATDAPAPSLGGR
ncbi:glycosyltransferase [Isoptericola sp. b441]|uniref:Glycosyltransferase n=1 Tax=Actinotalea lenta TaxID=3064654 RepID=A0ABT9DCK6_9CELL|nr:glycosyltransferase [Isoptericola sp. b441]MDO8107021.1 glycosyltransferase [Isoptericola sp. b441]